MRFWFHTLTARDVEKREEYVASREYVDAFEPDKNKSYAWVYEHAMRLYDAQTSRIAALDEKADRLFRYLAPGSGIAGVIVAWFLGNVDDPYVFWAVAAGVVAIVLALISVVYVQMPHMSALPPSVSDATRAVEYYETEDQAKANLSSGIDSAITWMIIVANIKAKYLVRSYFLFVTGFACLLVGVVWTLRPWNP